MFLQLSSVLRKMHWKSKIFENSVSDGHGSSMICEPFFLRGRTWNLPPLLRKHLSHKLQVMYRWNLFLFMLTRIHADVPTYERPLAVTPFGDTEQLPDWQDTHAMQVYAPLSSLRSWARTDLGVRTFQGLGRNAPKREQVVRRLTKDLHTAQILESLPCEPHLQVSLHRRCLPGCGPHTWATRDIQTTFVYKPLPFSRIPKPPGEELSPAPLPSGGGVPCSFLRLCRLRLSL